MPEQTVLKDKASPPQQLAYLESIAQTKLGLQSSSRAFLARRAHADSDETRQIDIQIERNDSEWSKVNAFEILYYSEQYASFNPPTSDDLINIRAIVKDLDGLIASQTKASEILAKASMLIEAWNQIHT